MPILSRFRSKSKLKKNESDASEKNEKLEKNAFKRSTPLTRSDTFTVKDDVTQDIKKATTKTSQPTSSPKVKRKSAPFFGTFTRKKGESKQRDTPEKVDPFEQLYTKRPSSLKTTSGDTAVSREEKIKSRKFDGSTYRKGKPDNFDGNTYRKVNTRYSPIEHDEEEEENITSNEPVKQYYFGSQERSKSPEKPSKKGVDDKNRTVTLNSVRRSFRNQFMEKSRPADGKEYHPIWFIDVNKKDDDQQLQQRREKKKELTPTADGVNKIIYINDNFRGLDAIQAKGRTPVQRKETFRVERNAEPIAVEFRSRSDKRPSLDALRTDRRDSSESVRVERKPNRVDFHHSNERRAIKTAVPVAVTAPYKPYRDDVNADEYDNYGENQYNENDQYYYDNRYARRQRPPQPLPRPDMQNYNSIERKHHEQPGKITLKYFGQEDVQPVKTSQRHPSNERRPDYRRVRMADEAPNRNVYGEPQRRENSRESSQSYAREYPTKQSALKYRQGQQYQRHPEWVLEVTAYRD